MNDKFLSVKQASEFLCERGIELKPASLRKKLQRRELPFYALGRPRLKESDLMQYIESKRIRARRWPAVLGGQR